MLLPPSEGKAVPTRGAALDLGSLSFPTLGAARERVLDALVEHCATDPERAAATLGLGRTQADLVALDAALRTAPTARAERIYTGVLYDALDLGTLSATARRRAGRRLVVTSALFGLVRPADRIPAYRLSGDVSLPGLGPVAGVWREQLSGPLLDALGQGLLLDLRSTTYAAFWRPGRELAPPRCHGARAARVRWPADGGQPLQQGHQGSAGARPAGGRRGTPDPGWTGGPACRARLEGGAGGIRASRDPGGRGRLRRQCTHGWSVGRALNIRIDAIGCSRPPWK